MYGGGNKIKSQSDEECMYLHTLLKTYNHNPNIQSNTEAGSVTTYSIIITRFPLLLLLLLLNTMSLWQHDCRWCTTEGWKRDNSSSTPRWLPHRTSLTGAQRVLAKTVSASLAHLQWCRWSTAETTVHTKSLPATVCPLVTVIQRAEQIENISIHRENFTYLLHCERHADAVLLHQHSPWTMVMALQRKM